MNYVTDKNIVTTIVPRHKVYSFGYRYYTNY